MIKLPVDPSTKLLSYWRTLQHYPFGSFIFSRILGFLVPYSGSIRAHVVALEKGYARVVLKDRRRVRNHLNSIHAVALLNVGELATGLSMISNMRPELRAIVLSLKAEYLKKARGLLTVEAFFNLPENFEDNTEFEVQAEIKDDKGEVVTIVTALWLLGYKDQS